MKAKGKDLIFISQIKRDGSGVNPCTEPLYNLDETEFQITCLSISNGTWIASEFNSFVVKLKPK